MVKALSPEILTIETDPSPGGVHKAHIVVLLSAIVIMYIISEEQKFAKFSLRTNDLSDIIICRITPQF